MKPCAGSLTGPERTAIQPSGGGSSPTPALHFFQFPCGLTASKFVRDHHYSGKCPPAQYYFGIDSGGTLAGVATFRRPSLPKIQTAYGADIELSRLVLLDEVPKNSESRFIGWCLRWLKQKSSCRKVISFADPRQGHRGTIYRASNFVYLGAEKGHGTRRVMVDGEEIHAKTAFDRWGCSGANLKKLLPGCRVEIIVNPPKHVYVYTLK